MRNHRTAIVCIVVCSHVEVVGVFELLSGCEGL